MQLDESELLQRVTTVENRFAQITQLLEDSSQRLVDMQFELEQDQLQGQQIQRGMLPKQDKAIGGFRCSRWLAPSLILSGDFVDYFPLQDKYLACFLADVAGHGASSALLTVQLKNISWRLQQKFGSPSFNSPGAMLGWINATLIEQAIEKHVAMFLGIIDKNTNVLHYSTGAQFPPAMLVDAQGEISVLEQSGKPLGLFPDAHYHSASIEFPLGAQLLVFSDGVLDCLAPTDLAEKEAALLQAIGRSDGGAALWDMLRAQFDGVDDMSLMAVKRIS
jgi:serine phosphatase RsbU (regulator of sigma subunit)